MTPHKSWYLECAKKDSGNLESCDTSNEEEQKHTKQRGKQEK